MKPALLLLAVVAAALAAGNGYFLNLLVAAGMLALPALGLSLLTGYTGQISLGHAAFVAVGAYGATLGASRLGLHPWAALLLATSASAVMAWAVGWLVFRLRGHYLAMATLGLGIIVHVCLVEWRSVTGGQDGLAVTATLTVGSWEVASDATMLPMVGLICLVAALLTTRLVRSPAGLAMRVVARNEAVAGSIGLSTDSVKRQVMALSGALAGLGGALYAHWIGYVSPGAFDVGLSIRLLLIVALGGFAGIWSVLFAALFVVVVGELLKPLGRFDVIVYGLLLVGVMVWCPRGLLGGLSTLVQWISRGARRAVP